MSDAKSYPSRFVVNTVIIGAFSVLMVGIWLGLSLLFDYAAHDNSDKAIPYNKVTAVTMPNNLTCYTYRDSLSCDFLSHKIDLHQKRLNYQEK